MRTLRIAIVTDAWYPQIDGVVRTLDTVRSELTALGHTIEIIAPDRFRSIPTPSYPEIPLALFPARKVRRLLEAFAPEAIHIAIAARTRNDIHGAPAPRYSSPTCIPSWLTAQTNR